MKKLWLVTMLVGLFYLIVVYSINLLWAEEKVEFQIGIPHYITEAYIKNEDPLECLVALDFIPICKDVAVVPFVQEGDRRFMEVMGVAPEGLQVVLECIICTCKDHKGNRVQVINGLDEDEVMQLLWTNPDVLKEDL